MPPSFWNTVIWSDESKYELKNRKRRLRVSCEPQDRLKSKYTRATAKHGGESLMVWGCFSSSRVGNLVKIDSRMTGPSYVEILKENLAPSAEKMHLGQYIRRSPVTVGNFFLSASNFSAHRFELAKFLYQRRYASNRNILFFGNIQVFNAFFHIVNDKLSNFVCFLCHLSPKK